MNSFKYHSVKIFPLLSLILIVFSLGIESATGQESSYRPGLAFREDWKELPAAIPVTQEHVNHPDLILGLYGPGKDSIKKSHHDTPVDDPWYIWSGLTLDNWALTLKHKSKVMDLSSYGRIKWRSKQSGFRKLHLILKLEDGSWIISKEVDACSGDWRIKEFIIDDMEWYGMDIQNMIELKALTDPDLSGVIEIGFTDLMRGGGSNACSRIDWIEVYAYLVDSY